MSAETLDDWMEPLGAPGWADDVAADSRADDDRFVITDDRAASWALRKRAKATADVHRVTADVGERRELLDAYQDHATASARHTIEFMDGLLADYGRRVLAEDPDRKTIDLPEGRIRSRTTKPVVAIVDVWVVADWLDNRALSEFVEWTPKVKVGDVRKHTQVAGDKAVDMETGEVVPGLSVKPGGTSFSIDTDGGA